MKTLGQKMKNIGPARRKKVVTRTAGLIAEEMTSQEHQQTPKLTEVWMAKGSRFQPGSRFPTGKA